MTLQELLEQRAAVWEKMKEINDRAESSDAGQLTGEDEEQWQRANTDYEGLTSRIERQEQMVQMESRMKSDSNGGVTLRDVQPDFNDGPPAERKTESTTRTVGKPTAEHRNLALQGWLRLHSDMEVRDDHVEAARVCGVNLRAGHFDIELESRYDRVKQEVRQQGTGAGAGGETIPEGFSFEWEKALLAFGGIRQISRVFRTASGNAMPWPTTDDTGNAATIVAENSQTTAVPFTTAEIIFGAYKYSSAVITSVELLEDSAFNMAAEIGMMLGERLGRGTSAHFATGTGTGQPEGISVGSALGTTAAGSAITGDEMIDLAHSVDPAYRMANAYYVMNDSTLAAIRKLQDSQGQYLWQPSLQAGAPGLYNGYPVQVDQGMADIGAAAVSVVFGDFSRYVIRDVASVRLRRLVERYAENDQEGFFIFSRHDAKVLDAGTNPLKHLVHP